MFDCMVSFSLLHRNMDLIFFMIKSELVMLNILFLLPLYSFLNRVIGIKISFKYGYFY